MSSFLRIFNILILFLKDILAPKKCFSCNKEGNFLCDKCFLKLDNFEPFCYICKKKSENYKIHKKCLIENKMLSGKNFNDKKIYLDRVIVMTHYKNDVIKKLITHFKFYGKKDIGIELGEKLGNFVKNNNILDSLSTEGFNSLNNLEKDYFNDSESSSEGQPNILTLPVPLHFFKKLKRGFNQSEILAESFAKTLNIDYNKKVIIRRKYTRQQSKITRQERLTNLDNSFKIRKKQLDNIDKKIIFLIDDVVTSGTTLNEIAKVLKQNGAKKVIGVCLASN